MLLTVLLIWLAAAVAGSLLLGVSMRAGAEAREPELVGMDWPLAVYRLPDGRLVRLTLAERV